MSNTPTAEEFLRALPPVLRNDSRMIALGQVVAEELSERFFIASLPGKLDGMPDGALDPG